MKSELTAVTEREQWNSALEKHKVYDFYHTYGYHQLSKKKEEKAVLLAYDNIGVTIHLPLLIRPVPGQTNVYDATSVYGYPGPLCTGHSISSETITSFKASLLDFFRENNIVSVFSRLNPFIPNQEIVLQDLGDIEILGSVVNIDLTKDVEEQRTLFSKTTKRYINKVRKICTTRISKEKEDILKFIELYYENMDRVNADQSYYFDYDYFFNFIHSPDFETDVIFAELKDTGKVISAAMMVKTNNIIQYHISGTLNDYLEITPIRLLIDTMRIRGTEQGYTFFNLGGGLGSQNDSLLRFKSSFSKDFRDFKVWKLIVDQTKYNQLTGPKAEKVNSLDNTFFPLYRYELTSK
ncbi:peptidoglycan bridge formation glycyltransferase FemA/FemB family protein [Flagellimonas hymeniacidonis]|uniref:Peptidoglycan bridge formation glycyltransferase FemA/FemB family protein n=1 Tax=Flagellimonas hymeniacidonis TaxID=2603628 RepID=A0A5C8V4N9_9FLAO|nr:GNAT family N-acetyltransferase [Flagellimonas hymeniacidonis]TXN35985.1 peptidoglycan bridge formation glycyltransferase FemA/FemB family protein [Flagellimonas hymeniacidonis]